MLFFWNNDVLRLMGNFWSNEGFYDVCVTGDLPKIKAYVDTYNITVRNVRANDNFLFRFACRHGHFDAVIYLSEYFKLTPDDARSYDNDAILGACEHGHLNIAQYLVRHFNLTVEDIRSHYGFIFAFTCSGGHLDVALKKARTCFFRGLSITSD